MKRLTMLMILAMVGIACNGGQVIVANHGQSRYAIAVPDGQEEREKVTFAASSLQKYIRLSTGCELPILAESEVANRPAFYLGRTAKGAKAGVPYDKMHDYVNCRKVIGADVLLAGCDDSADVTGSLQHHDREYLGQFNGLNLDVKDQSYRRCHGTLKAVLGFLEEADVVKILMPGEYGRHVIKHEVLTIPDDLDYFGSPAIPYAFGRNYGDLETTVALNHNNPPFFMNYGGHSFHVAVPAHRYAKSHPEYFIMKDGKRQPHYGPAGGNHLCLTNPDVKRLMLEEVERQVKNGYTWVQIGPTDGQVPCECETCMAVAGGDPCERQWLFYRSLAEEAQTRWPDLKIVLLSYELSKDPPKTFDTFPKNTVIQLCIGDEFAQKFRDFAAFRKVPKLSYIYFFGSYHSLVFFPKRSYKYVADNLRILAENNVQGVLKCGWTTSLGLEGPVSYVFSKLLENPTADFRQLADDFYRYAYGTAYEPMKRFFEGINSNLDTPAGHSVINELERSPRNPNVLIQAVFSPGVVSYLAHALWEAEGKKDPDPAVRARIALVRRDFNYLRCVVKMYALTNAFVLAPSPALIPLLEQAETEMNQLLDSWYDEDGGMKMEKGFYWPMLENATKTTLRYGGGMTPYVFPQSIAKGLGAFKRQVNVPLAPKDCVTFVARTARADDFLHEEGNASFMLKSGEKVSFLCGVANDEQLCFKCTVKPSEKHRDAVLKRQTTLDVFLQRASEKGTGGYYQLTVNQDGALSLRGADNEKTPSWSSECRIEVQTDNASGSWKVIVWMPWKKLCVKRPVPNEDWKCNVRVNGETWSPASFGTSAADIANWGNLRFLSVTKVLPKTDF